MIKQDARIYQLLLAPSETAQLNTSAKRHYYVHVIDGELKIAGETLRPGDGAKLSDISALQLNATKQRVKALVFDLP